jgi:hypothetical protein
VSVRAIEDPWEIVDRIDSGDASAVEDAVTYLEADPYEFRTGYAKAKLFRRLRQTTLTESQVDRLHQVLLHTVDVGPRWELREASSLARRIGNRHLRDELVRRLHGADADLASRAMAMLLRLRRAKLAPADVERARALLLRWAAENPALSASVPRRIRRLWTPEWGRALREISEDRTHPDSVAARRLLRDIRRRTERSRNGPPASSS